MPFVSGQDSKGVLSQNTDKLKHGFTKVKTLPKYLFGYEVLDKCNETIHGGLSPFKNLTTKRLKALKSHLPPCAPSNLE